MRLLSPLGIVIVMGFPGGASGKEDVSNVDSISGLGRSSGVGSSNPMQYSFLENFMNRGAWWVTVHGVTKSWTGLSN